MNKNSTKQPTYSLDPNQIGEVWPASEPGSDPVLFGSVTVSPSGSFQARSLQTFNLTFTAGRFGVDEGGGIRLVSRFANDWGDGILQTDDPTKQNYVTASTSAQAELDVKWLGVEGSTRPWYQVLNIRPHHGHLREGDTITVVLGDKSQGSPGLRLQSCVEPEFQFRILVDPCATYLFSPVANSPRINIVPGPVDRWKAVIPTLRRPGETFRLGIKAEDEWGNPTDQAGLELHLSSNLPVSALPETLTYDEGTFATTIDGLQVRQEGILRILVHDSEGNKLAETNPLLISDAPNCTYWGDLHGQSGESVGINTARHYFEFARDRAFLDVTSHQANDFQINKLFWAHLNELTAEFQEDHRFVTYPGYEWSGNTGVGGDRNVYYREEGWPIHRSSHALLPDTSDIDDDANDAKVLFEKLKDRDAVVYAHIGGRWADIGFSHDPKIEYGLEIHSAWGTFEWLMEDAFKLGYRCGVVCNSDGHKGRPGASYPGASWAFSAYGGLTCFIAEELTRDGIFDALRRRHTYGTTGNRLHLDVRANFKTNGLLYDRDPSVFDDARNTEVSEAIMGDIIQTTDTSVDLSVSVISGSPIETIQIRNGTEVLEVYRPYKKDDLGERIRVMWSGANCRGKSARVRWNGNARFSDARIEKFEKINVWSPERLMETQDESTVVWQSAIAGNLCGFDVWLDGSRDGTIDIETDLMSASVPLSEIGLEGHVFDAGGLARQLRVSRMMNENPHCEVKHSIEVPLQPGRDNPLWVCVTTEDGYQAWSSPIYLTDSVMAKADLEYFNNKEK